MKNQFKRFHSFWVYSESISRLHSRFISIFIIAFCLWFSRLVEGKIFVFWQHEKVFLSVYALHLFFIHSLAAEMFYEVFELWHIFPSGFLTLQAFSFFRFPSNSAFNCRFKVFFRVIKICWFSHSNLILNLYYLLVFITIDFFFLLSFIKIKWKFFLESFSFFFNSTSHSEKRTFQKKKRNYWSIQRETH